MSAGELVLLRGAAFTAGGVNAVAGGGTCPPPEGCLDELLRRPDEKEQLTGAA